MPNDVYNSHYEKLPNGEVRCIDNEIPFEIPSNWAWERWGNIAYSIVYGYNAPAEDHGDIRMVRISDIQDNKVIWEKVPFCKIPVKDIETYLLKPNDILFARTGGTVGKSYIVSDVPYPSIYAGYLIRTQYSNLLCPQYLKFFMESPLYWEELKEGTTATAQPNCNGKKLAAMLLPVPPMREQERIVAKLGELVHYIERYNITQSKLDALNTDINTSLKKSILQEAIQGRLVPQDSNDEPATKLLERIRVEKQKLVKEGKLKTKDITDSIILKGDDNKYYKQIGSKNVEISSDFDFPNTWEVVRLADICRLIDGEKKEGKFVCLDAKYLRGKSSGDMIEQGKFVVKGYNIILVDGENSGEVFTVPCDGYMGSTFKQLWVSKEMYLPYVLYFIQFYKDRLRNSKKGAAIPHLNKEIFYNLLIGIPPKEEQIRISSKVANLYSNL